MPRPELSHAPPKVPQWVLLNHGGSLGTAPGELEDKGQTCVHAHSRENRMSNAPWAVEAGSEVSWPELVRAEQRSTERGSLWAL